MTEDEFSTQLLHELRLDLGKYKAELKCCLLYDLYFDERGAIRKGVDPDTGKPVRGRGTGFEQDLVIFEVAPDGADTSIIPRIVAEIKYGSVTTHNAIVYSEKARRIRRVYPYLRYGMIIGNFLYIPGRLLRLGQDFDFLCALEYPLVTKQLDALRETMKLELATSVGASDLLSGRRKPFLVHRDLRISESGT